MTVDEVTRSMAVVKKDEQNQLGVLVDQVCEANGWSRRDLSRRAEERGHTLSQQNVSKVCTAKPLTNLSANVLFALAAALSITPTRVATAAVEAMGIPASQADLTTAEAIHGDPSLSVDTKAALLSILRTAKRTGGDRSGDSAATNIDGVITDSDDNITLIEAKSPRRAPRPEEVPDRFDVQKKAARKPVRKD